MRTVELHEHTRAEVARVLDEARAADPVAVAIVTADITGTVTVNHSGTLSHKETLGLLFLLMNRIASSGWDDK